MFHSNLKNSNFYMIKYLWLLAATIKRDIE